MNKMMLFRSIILFLIIFSISDRILGQTMDFNTREVMSTTPDSIIKTCILNKVSKKKILPEYNYYWYYAGFVNHNIGGFSGKLLHGKYEVLDNQQKLRVQGSFEYGLMNGVWYRWYPNGNILFSGYYKNGLLQGKAKTFTTQGKPSSLLTYHHGQLNGKSYFFYDDTVITKKYKDGKELIKNKKLPRKKQATKIEKIKKEPITSKEQTSQPIPGKEQVSPANKMKNKWWKLSFLKKKQVDEKIPSSNLSSPKQ